MKMNIKQKLVLVLSLFFVMNISLSANVNTKDRGMWIWQIWVADGGNLTTMINKMKAANISWVTLKMGDSDSYYYRVGKSLYNWAAPYGGIAKVVSQFHNNGIKVYGWQYVYSYGYWKNPVTETDVADSILNVPGIDGLIVDAEAEYEGQATAATAYMQALRILHPNAFIAFSSFARVTGHTTFPWMQFGQYCDVNMPQAYWAARPKTVDAEMSAMVSDFAYYNTLWAKNGYAGMIKPMVPVGQGGPFATGQVISSGDISKFCTLSQDQGYEGVSLYEYTILSSATWTEYSTSLAWGLDAPILLSPKDSSSGLSASPAFNWNSVPGADKYKLQVSNFPDFGFNKIDLLSTDTNYNATGLTNDTVYYWRIRAQGTNLYSKWTNGNTFDTKITGIFSNQDNSLPDKFELFQNYPNPFNPATEIKYSLTKSGFVTLKIYDLLGNIITTLVNEGKGAGYHSVRFNAANLSSGAYIYQISVDGLTMRKKMLFLK